MTHGGWMILVSDASVAVKWAVEEEYYEKAAQLLSGEHQLHVPRVLAAELANALWSKVRSGSLTSSEAPGLLGRVLALHLEWANDAELASDALRIAISLNHAVYDCVYLALAYQVNGMLVTADARFVNTLAATEHADRVILLENFAAAQG